MKPVISDIIIRHFQKKYIKAYGVNIEAFQPTCDSKERPFEGGVLLNEVQYESPYPNSIADIFYCGNPEPNKPTVIYLHGGGFFMGGRSIGDPLTRHHATEIARQHIHMAKQGFNVVSMDYCVTPKYRFPSQILQVNDGLKWLRKQADTLHLDMDNVIIFGGSAGAVITAILGCAFSNPEYAASLDLVQGLPLNAIKGLAIDGAPLYADRFNWALRAMFRSWIGTSNLFGKKAKMAFIPAHLAKGFPKTFLTAGNDGCFKEHEEDLASALRNLDVDVTEFYPDINLTHEGHGYLGNWESSSEANRGMEATIAFFKKATTNKH